tara:strand:- start:11857 stop:12054 length:198 start_codon:yes stop_codon:yes gene_type:complete
MDTWTLGEKFKAQAIQIKQLETRIKHIEGYLLKLTINNKVEDEKVQDKESKSSGVRARRQVTKKS